MPFISIFLSARKTNMGVAKIPHQNTCPIKSNIILPVFCFLLPLNFPGEIHHHRQRQEQTNTSQQQSIIL